MNRSACSTLLALLACLLPACASGTPSGDRASTAAEPEHKTVKLYVEGMTCPTRCPREIREMLMSVAGVVEVSVDVPSQTVVCEIEGRTNPDLLVAAIKNPYRARLL